MPDRMMIEPRVMEGVRVRLEPVGEADREEIREVLESDPDHWTIQTTKAIGDGFPDYWRKMIGTPDRITLAVRDKASGAAIGTSSFMGIDPKHRNLEIGYTFFRPEYRGTAINPETKLLMLSEAFAAGAVRVQFSVSGVNKRSQAAVLKIGARQEGVLRKRVISWTGEVRDAVIFSIIDEEWPAVEAGLRARVAAA